jgi:D-glycero-alpha-D-manno-heptose-7-phosphate kinase
MAPGRTVIRARAPLRLALAGDGTDVSPHCDEFGGAVLNVTINRYAYAFIEPSEDGRVHFAARDLGIEESFSPDPRLLRAAQLAMHGGVYRRMMANVKGEARRPLRITTYADAPPGSGLGSSSSLMVALVEAFRALLALPLGRYDLAHLASEIERGDLGLAGGRQDYYAAAFGGPNFIEFLDGDRVIVNPLSLERGVINELEASLVTCHTGASRRSQAIIEEQRRRMAPPGSAALAGLRQLKQDAIEMKQALVRGEIRHMAEILNRSWQAKKPTGAGISTQQIDDLYETALSHGALAGKVSGAGGGSLLMFIVPPPQRITLIQALREAGVQAGGPHLTGGGAESWSVAGEA